MERSKSPSEPGGTSRRTRPCLSIVSLLSEDDLTAGGHGVELADGSGDAAPGEELRTDLDEMGAGAAGEGAQANPSGQGKLVGLADLLGQADGHHAPAGLDRLVEVIDLKGDHGPLDGGPKLCPVSGAEDDVILDDGVVHREDRREGGD